MTSIASLIMATLALITRSFYLIARYLLTELYMCNGAQPRAQIGHTKPRRDTAPEASMQSVPTSLHRDLKVRLRVIRGSEDAFGPGKTQLLESLAETGSLNRSASAMKRAGEHGDDRTNHSPRSVIVARLRMGSGSFHGERFMFIS